jgi:hypothetical protein
VVNDLILTPMKLSKIKGINIFKNFNQKIYILIITQMLHFKLDAHNRKMAFADRLQSRVQWQEVQHI